MPFQRRAILAVVILCSLSAPYALAQTPTTQPVDLLEGATWNWKVHRLATQPSSEAASQPTSAASRPATPFHLVAEAEFQVAYPPRYTSLNLTHGMYPLYTMKFSLTGHAITPPLEGMQYETIPGIDASWLTEGRNVLTAEVSSQFPAGTKKPPRENINRLEAQGPKMKLTALRAEDLAIEIGPILGAVGEDSYTVVCRTNMPARITLTAEGAVPGHAATSRKIKTTSQTGLIHRFTIEGIQPRVYQLEARASDSENSVKLGPWTVGGRNAEGKLCFVALGDNRSNPVNWSKVATAAAQAKPDLVVHTGDLVSRGRCDWLWREQFFAPAGELLATVPFLPVIGNHENEAPLYYKLFPSPGGREDSPNWQRTVAGVQFVGIDGEADWSAGGENAQWLEGVLAGSKARFIFLITHYPAWSSSPHGRLDEKGEKAAERPVAQAREVILPLLARYGVAAMIAGHDHNYQRSEPPEGVSVIVTGGAGAPLYKQSENAEKQNPPLKVFADVLNYCLFTVDGDTCVMQALTPEGKELDTRTWKARAVGSPAALTSGDEGK